MIKLILQLILFFCLADDSNARHLGLNHIILDLKGMKSTRQHRGKTGRNAIMLVSATAFWHSQKATVYNGDFSNVIGE